MSCAGATTAGAAELLSEDEVVRMIRCRLDELAAVGCSSPACVLLAARLDVELERARALVVSGCPPHLALRILT